MKAICLGYGPEQNIKRCLQLFYDEDFQGEKVFFDLGFPGNLPLNFVTQLGWEHVRASNLGCARNWDRAYKRLGSPIKLLGVEPDELPSKGWSRAVEAVLDDSSIGIVTLCKGDEHEKFYIPHLKPNIYTINGYRVAEFPLGYPTPWPCSGFNGAVLEQGFECIGFYGATEQMLQKKCHEMGFKVVHLIDFKAEHLVGDENYERWKVLSGDGQTSLSFEQWRKTQGR